MILCFRKLLETFLGNCPEIAQKLRGMKKDQENSAHYFEDNYLTNCLLKFLQDSIKL